MTAPRRCAAPRSAKTTSSSASRPAAAHPTRSPRSAKLAARGALTVGVANNRGSALLRTVDLGILIETGEEVVAGSTRMKAGTAQKIVLNLFDPADDPARPRLSRADGPYAGHQCQAPGIVQPRWSTRSPAAAWKRPDISTASMATSARHAPGQRRRCRPGRDLARPPSRQSAPRPSRSRRRGDGQGPGRIPGGAAARALRRGSRRPREAASGTAPEAMPVKQQAILQALAGDDPTPRHSGLLAPCRG